MSTAFVFDPHRWLAADPDPATRDEVGALLEASAAGDPAATLALSDRFGARLQFGTAGLRGELGAGPNRMNRVIVRIAATGLARYLLETVPDAATRGVVIGFDARHQSDTFAADTARVLAATGITARLFDSVVPTPLLAFAVSYLGCAAGVQVTASHNPAADNGYKVYLGDGAQIVPPADAEISVRIDAVAAEVAADPSALVLAELSDTHIHIVGDDVMAGYIEGCLALDPRTSDAGARENVAIVYTSMHGVGGALTETILARAGYTHVHPVAEQAVPDPDFPTVAFPNPEEQGALDLAFADARRLGADLVLANDPDADRLAAAVPDRSASGGWRRLSGDEVGWLLADHLLSAVPGDDGTGRGRLVATTIVSSTRLRAMAAAAGVEYAETLTGFKWLARVALDRPDLRLVLAYEEALGYCVGELVRDKDGISAALVLADLAASCASTGTTLLDRLTAIERESGVYRTAQWSIRFDGSDAIERMGALMGRLRASPPAELAGTPVTAVHDLSVADPPADVVVLRLGEDARVVVRPSGTEPKCKVYFEVRERPGTTTVPIDALHRAMAVVLAVAP